jgi:hypothetical protein
MHAVWGNSVAAHRFCHCERWVEAVTTTPVGLCVSLTAVSTLFCHTMRAKRQRPVNPPSKSGKISQRRHLPGAARPGRQRGRTECRTQPRDPPARGARHRTGAAAGPVSRLPTCSLPLLQTTHRTSKATHSVRESRARPTSSLLRARAPVRGRGTILSETLARGP